MSPLKWLNNLLFLENLLGIYRSYFNQKNQNKCFIIFQIFVQIMLHTLFVILIVYFLIQKNVAPLQINLIYCSYAILVYVTAMPAVVTGICYSRAFESYERSINRVSDFFKDDVKLINSFRKIYWLSATVMVLFLVIAIYRSVPILIQANLVWELLMIGPILASQSILKITVLFQYLMFFVVIMIVFVLSERLTMLISVVDTKVRSRDVSLDEQTDITREQIQGWVELYRDLANCCVKLTVCFGRQYFFCLISALVYYVSMTYHICYINPIHSGSKDEYEDFAIIVFVYFSIMILPLIAGQKASNQGLKLQRELVRLYNTMITYDTNEDETKLIKDFIRLTKKNRIEIKLISKTPAGVYLLPVILSWIVNCLIIMLQFMHVV